MRKYTRKEPCAFLPASELTIEVLFETDESFEGILRARQAKTIIANMILLSKRRGRPRHDQEVDDEAA